MPGRNGGTLRRGGPNGGAGGRPTNELRDRYRDVVNELGPDIVREIASGKPIQRTRVRLLDVYKYCACANCGELALKPAKLEEALFIEIDAEISASPRDRIGALEHAGKYSVGPLKEITVKDVRERLNRTLDKIQTHTSAEQFAAIVKDIEPEWA